MKKKSQKLNEIERKHNGSKGALISLAAISVIVLISILATYPSPTKQVNLLKNPGFEDGSPEWEYIHGSEHWKSYVISEDVAHSGQKSALMRLRADEYSINTTVVGTLQNIYATEMPKKVSGHYLARNWIKGAEKQYIQCVVMAFDVPEYVDAPVQLRYLISGIDTEPFQLENAKFIIINENDPPENSWVLFERDLHKDFMDTWGFVPADFSMIRIVFEVRYDDVPYSICTADVYWDDVYLGNYSRTLNT